MAVTGAGFIPYMWEFARHCRPIAPPRFPVCAKRAQVINDLLIDNPATHRPLHIWGDMHLPQTDIGYKERPRQRTIRGESKLWTTAPVIHKGSQHLHTGGSARCGNLVGNPWGVRRAHQPHIPGKGCDSQPEALRRVPLLTSPQALLLRLLLL